MPNNGYLAFDSDPRRKRVLFCVVLFWALMDLDNEKHIDVVNDQLLGIF